MKNWYSIYKIDLSAITKRILEADLNNEQLDYLNDRITEIEKLSDEQARENEEKIFEAIRIAKQCP